MRDVSIVGIGMTPVGEHWDSSIRQLGAAAGVEALKDAGLTTVDAVYVGNAYGSSYSSQSHLGAMIADHMGLKGVESFAVDAGDASGGAALRTGYLAVASGLVNSALIIGVEKSTDTIGSARVQARNISLDADFESMHGATLPALAALLMRRYMHEYGVSLDAFEGFSVNAHGNGKKCAHAMFRNTLRAGAFAKAPMVADPVNLFDSAPDADGAAAVLLVASDKAADMVPNPIKITGSAAATDTLMLQDRTDMLYLNAVESSFNQALAQAQLSKDDLSLIEFHDAFTILTALALEAAGYAERGQGWSYADNSGERIGLAGELPISTFGGLKSRGNPAGATGIYQAVEGCLQLRGLAGDNQVADAKAVAIQSMGGLGSTVITHILQI